MSTEVLTYNATYNITHKRYPLLLYLLVFLLSRITILDGLFPFGMGIFSASFGSKINKLLLSACILLGILTTTKVENAIITLLYMLIFTLLHKTFSKKNNEKALLTSVIAMVSRILVGIVEIYQDGFLTYDILQIVFDGILVLSTVFIFKLFLAAYNKINREQSLTSQEVITMSMTIILAVVGIGSLSVGDVSIRNVLCILIIMVVSFIQGPGASTALGVTCGLMIFLTSGQQLPSTLTSYSICGLLSGTFRELGKPGICIGFLGGFSLISLGFSGATDTIVFLTEMAVSALIFISIPKKMYLSLGEFICGPKQDRFKQNYGARIKRLTAQRLEQFSSAFSLLSKSFKASSLSEKPNTKEGFSELVNQLAERVCIHCGVCRYCWDQNFEYTYQTTYGLFETLEKAGEVFEEDLPPNFHLHCNKLSDLIAQSSHVFDLYTLDSMWKTKTVKNRGLISQQFDGISQVISGLAQKISKDIHIRSDLEETIYYKLKSMKVDVQDINITENAESNQDITVILKGCDGECLCQNLVADTVSKTVAKKVIPENSHCVKNRSLGVCEIKYVEENRFFVTTGVARLAKENNAVSGDSYTFLSTINGKYILALSDGMGSGEEANLQSQSTIALLERLIESGFEKDYAVSLINSVLLQTSDETFATLDICIIDLFKGLTEFVKIGAVPTFIKKENTVQTVKSINIPAGILENVNLELITRQVHTGDFVIMMSDGIYDAFQEDGEEIASFIEKLDLLNPKAIADSLLDKAIYFYGGKAKDDMTVLCAKIWEKG